MRHILWRYCDCTWENLILNMDFGTHENWVVPEKGYLRDGDVFAVILNI